MLSNKVRKQTGTTLVIGLILGCAPSYSQQAALAQPASDKPLATSAAEEVVLDLVVRDKKGKAVRDLQESDIEILDNGSPKKIKSFRLVDGKEALSKAGTVTLDPLRQLRLVTLVFEHLGTDARRFSRSAALDLIKAETGPNVYYAVFAIDQQLSALQQFTNDKAQLKRAIERATGGAYSEFASDSAKIKRDLETLVGGPAALGNTSTVEAVAGVAGPGRTNNSSEALMANLMLQILQFEESISREQQGRSSIYGLMSIVKEQNKLPGRKTVLYFSEGLVVPVNLVDPFHAVIANANRSNVSVYAIDSRGLVTSAQNTGAVSELRDAAASSNKTSLSDDSNVTRDQIKALDRAEESIRINGQTSLAELAEGTGGFLIANTNDYRNPLRKVNEDINSYYEVTYNPAIENYDGRFRKIAVKSNRSDLKIQTRSGYFAIPSGVGDVTNAYEVPLLKALAAAPLPRAVEYRAGAMHFQQVPGGVKCAVVVEVPMSNLTFSEDKAKSTYKAHLSMVALVKDQKGTVVQKFTRDLPINGTLDKLEAVKSQGNFIFEQTFTIPAGRYTVESAVWDQEADKAAAKKASFLAKPLPASGPSISSIAMVRRFEPQPKAEDPEDPFHFENGKITPTLNSDVKVAKGSAMSMYFVVYPDKASADKPALIMEYLEDGKPVGRVTPALPAPDASGKIAYVATSPTENLKPGTYQVRAIVTQGPLATQETAMFTVQ